MAEDGELYVHLVSSDEEDENHSHGDHEEIHEDQEEVREQQVHGEELEEGEGTFEARIVAKGTPARAEFSERREVVPEAPAALADRLRSGNESLARGLPEAREEESPEMRPSKRRRKWEDGPYVKVTYGNLTRPALQRLQDLLRSWSASEDAVLQPRSNDLSFLLRSGGGELLSGTSVFLPGPGTREEAESDGEVSEKVPWWIELPVEEEPSAPSSSTTPAQNKTPKGLVRQLAVSTDVPAYDRGASTALTGSATLAKVSPLENDGEEVALLASAMPSSRAGDLSNDRCFNCSSYTHSLRQCPKPRDAAAISAARAEHMGSKNATDSNSGAPRRYHGLSRSDFLLQKFGEPNPGVLSARLRKALGIGELDPPPWLERMRVFGYPPGYLKSKNRASEEEDDAANVLPMFGVSGEEVAADNQQEGREEENGIDQACEGEAPFSRSTKIDRVLGMFAATVGARHAAAGAAERGEVAEEGEAETAKEVGSIPAEELGASEGPAECGAVPAQSTVREGANGGAVLAVGDEAGALEDGEIEEICGEGTPEGERGKGGIGREDSLGGRDDEPSLEVVEAFEEFEQTVKFPGLNAPIPEGACPRTWGVSEDMGSRELPRRSRSEARPRALSRRNNSYQPALLGAWPANFLPLQFWSQQYASHLLASAVLSPQRLTHRYVGRSDNQSPDQYGSPSSNRQIEDMDMSE